MKKLIVFTLAVGFLGVSIPAGFWGVARAGAINDFARGSYQLAVQPTPDEGDGDYVAPPPVTPPPASTKFLIGNRAQVSIAPNARLKVLGNLNLNLSQEVGSHPNRAIGTVTDGPGFLGGVGGGWYWKIDVDDGADGWMAESGLVKLQPKFEKDDKVKTLVSLYVRITPGGIPLGSLPLRSGVEGKIVEGPTYYKDYVWWKVNWGRVYCLGFIRISCPDSIGWSAEADIPGTTPYLAKVTIPVDTATNPPAQGGDFSLTAGTPVQKGGRAQISWNIRFANEGGSGLCVNCTYHPVGATANLFGPYRDSVRPVASRAVGTIGKEIGIEGKTDVQIRSGDRNYPTSLNVNIPAGIVDGIYVIELIVDYNGNASDKRAISNVISISGVVQTPVISSIEGPTLIKSGQTGTWKILATDPNNDTLVYFVTWGDGTSREYSYTPTFTHSYARVGNYSAIFEVNNAAGKTDKKTMVVVVNDEALPGDGNQMQFYSPAGGETWTQGQTRLISWNTPIAWNVSEISLILADTNGNNLNSIAIIKDNVPISIQRGGDFSWVIPTSIANGTYKIKATVNRRDTSSPNTILSNQFTITNQADGNNLPVISGVAGPTSLNSGQSGTWVVSASDPNGDVLSYSVAWGDGATSVAQSGSSFGHSYLAAGTYTARFTVSDGRGGSASRDVAVVVGGGNNTTFSFNERVKHIGGSAAWDSISWSGSGFGDFDQKKGSVLSQGADSGGKWYVIFDAGRNLSVPASDLESVGVPTGKWGFTSGNVLGRELKTRDNTLIVDPYYYTVISRTRSQGGLVWYYAQQNLSPVAVALQSGSGGSWNCRSILGRNINPSVFIDDTVCRYERGNRAPQANLTGPASAFTGTSGVWQFTASDPEGALSSYMIDWGDGSGLADGTLSGTSASKDIQHTYSQVGIFTITLTVADGGGLTTVASLVVTVTAPCSTRFQIQDRVKVSSFAENGLNVRPTPGGTTIVLGNQQADSQGVVIGGPQPGLSRGVNYCWWQVDYDTGADGWSAEKVGDQFMLEKISGGPGPEDEGIVITSPAAGDIWNVGDSKMIRWTTPAGVTKVHIYLAGVGYIALNVPNTGSYTWTIPAILNGRELNSSDFAISIYAADEGVMMSQTSLRFSIIPRTVREEEVTNQLNVTSTNEGVFCAQDLKLCLNDGSYVGRIPPACDFAACPTGTNLSSRFSIGDRVKAIVNSLQVRLKPPVTLNESPMGRVNFGYVGTITGGPVYSAGYWWWEIKWAVTGWSAEGSSDGRTFYLEKVVEGTTNPAATTTTTQTPKKTLTIKVGAYAPLFNNPQLPPLGNPQGLKTFELNGRVWTWVGSSGLWRLTSGLDLTIQY